jgi:Rha family phage regulatory protein
MWSGRLFSIQNLNREGETKMNELTIVKVNDGAYIDSRQVAEFVGKPHNDLMKSIRKYSGYLTAGTFSLSDFFVPNTYFDATGRELPCYLCARNGCELIAHKLTGEKGVLFTAAYIKRFRELEQAETERKIKAHERPRLGEFNSAVRNVMNGLTYVGASAGKVMGFLNGAYAPFGIKVQDDLPGYYDSSDGYFTATEIARWLSIYSDTGRPHAHAVSAIIAKLDMPVEKHVMVVPYGLVGVVLRYDGEVFVAVREWIATNGNPTEIPYADFNYHVNYSRPSMRSKPSSLRLSVFGDDDIDENEELYYDSDDDLYDWDDDDRDFGGEE